MKPTLFILAAGMGSRYGGLKQLDGLGPNGETIMDYSVYDALRAGFGKIVFVIRKDFEQEFRDKVLSKYEGHVPVEVVYQSIDKLPEACRRIFLLSKRDGLGNQEIADELGISIKTVKNQLTKAYARLREDLSDGHKPFFLPFL